MSNCYECANFFRSPRGEAMCRLHGFYPGRWRTMPRNCMDYGQRQPHATNEDICSGAKGIRVKFDIVPPTATAQQKGVSFRNGRPHFFKKKKVRDAEDFLESMLAPYAPAEPLRGPVCFHARWTFPFRKSERKSVTRAGVPVPHTSRPDLDNLEKNLLDVLTRLNFWKDDSLVAQKTTSKSWGPRPGIEIEIRPAGSGTFDGSANNEGKWNDLRQM